MPRNNYGRVSTSYSYSTNRRSARTRTSSKKRTGARPTKRKTLGARTTRKNYSYR